MFSRFIKRKDTANITDNLRVWSGYDWSQAGDEWSGPWGGSDAMWFGFILPRIQRYAFREHILEIAPGFGRCTQFLRRMCNHLTIVDLTPRCIDACRERFQNDSRMTFIVNDGRLLKGVADHSIDFAFSWDSLVHVDHEPMRSYVFELGRVLRPGGHAFLHHSNLGMHAADLQECARQGSPIDPDASLGNRRVSVSAAKIHADCREAGLTCILQEIFPWNDPRFFGDAITLIGKLPPGDQPEYKLWKRDDFREDVGAASRVAKMYPPAKQSLLE